MRTFYQSLNALLAGVPVAVVRGHLARVTVRLPWASFSRVDHDDDDGSSATSSRCEVELDGLELDAVALADLPGTECDDEDSAAASLHEQLKSSFITGADPLSTSVYSAFDAADAFHHDDPMVAEDLDCIEDDEGVRMLAVCLCANARHVFCCLHPYNTAQSIIDHFVGAIHVRVCNTVIQVHRELSDKDTCDSWIIRVPCISYKDTTDSGSSGATLKSIAPESITLSLKDAGGTESPIAQFAECQIRVEALEQGDRADRREHRINVTASVKRLIACVMPESMVKFASFIDALQRSVELSNAYERETRTAAATQNDRQFDGKWEAMTVDIFVISQQAAIDPRSFFQELNATAEHDKHGRLDDFAKLIGADHIKLSAEHVLMHLGSRKPPELKVFALSMAEYLTSKTSKFMCMILFAE